MKMRGESGSGRKGDFELCPAGPQVLVCCDVIDHGVIPVRSFDGKGMKDTHKISIRWMSENKMKDGRAYIVQKRYTLSSHKKSTLRRDLDAWRGRPLTDQQADEFELETLIGVNALGNIAHIKKPRGTFAEVVTLMPPMRGMAKITVDAGYVRVKDKDPHAPADPNDGGRSEYDDSDAPDQPEPPDEETPF